MLLRSSRLNKLRFGLATARLARSFCFAALLLGIATATANAASFAASLDNDTITMGETATLSLVFEGVPAKNAPALPAIPNLQISYAGPSSQTTFINGQVSYTLTHVYRVMPRQPGEYTIPAITTDVGGQ